MKNPAIHIKKKLFALLSGAITYNGESVPVYEGEGVQGIPYQVLIKEYSDADRSTKHSFGYNGTQVLEIVTERDDDTSKDADAIAEIVMDIIQPVVRSEMLSGDDFQVFTVGTPSKNLIRENSGAITICRRILRYNLLINEV